MPPEVVIEATEALAEGLALRTTGLARDAIAARGRFALALPGGSVAGAFLPALAGAPLDWARTDLFWGDERAVPESHPESNYALTVSLWLKDARFPGERVHRMPADVRVDGDSEDAAAAALDRAARDYERTMTQRLGTPPALDLALLGVGPDGHVCSLFPGHPLLGEERRFVAPVFDSPKPPAWRLTLTLPALAAARLVVVAAFGAAKAPVMREALRDPSSRLPVALVLRRAQAALVLLDPAAAQA